MDIKEIVNFSFLMRNKNHGNRLEALERKLTGMGTGARGMESDRLSSIHIVRV